ncbi:MAG: hypothetical protein M3R14_01460, partial [Acidobacteriota bacterium]|nr:hypothetical protein [Acidobacteriota bacterium]
YFNGINRVADFFIGGWQINSNTTWQSGFHFNVEYNGGADRDTGPNRPNLTGDVNYPGTRDQFISAASFTRPARGTFGDIPRNFFTGPSYYRTDASLLKKFRLTETMNFEFRLEVVNLFNTVNLGNPDSNLGNPLPNGKFDNANFGKITSTAFFGNDLQRNLQFAFRFTF